MSDGQTFNQRVVGSIPTALTKEIKHLARETEPKQRVEFRSGEGWGKDFGPLIDFPTLSVKPPPERRRADRHRLFHHDKPGAIQVFNKPLGDDPRHDLIIGVVNPLPAFELKRKDKGVGKADGSVGASLSESDMDGR